MAGAIDNRPLRPPDGLVNAPLLKRLPGTARPRREILRECETEVAEMRERIPRVLWVFLLPDLTKAFRWRVQLDCGCVTEVMTRGGSVAPHEVEWDEPVHRSKLPTGQMLCWHEDSAPAPYHDIISWGERKEVRFAADPVEPPEGIDPKTWSVIRHDEPHTSAFWTVTLACGHTSSAVAPDLDWLPASGPRRVPVERVQEMTAEFERAWLDDPDLQSDQDREHYRRMLADGWPSPQTAQACSTCPGARQILAYERIGWLVPRRRVPTPAGCVATKPPRSTLEGRLRQAEAEAERLRAELRQCGGRAGPER